MGIKMRKAGGNPHKWPGATLKLLPLIKVLWLKSFHTSIICDVIKQNQSEVRNIDFKIEPNKAKNVFCFQLFLASFSSYL